MPTNEDPRQVLQYLDQDLMQVLLGERLYDGSEPYVVLLTAKEARAIRALLRAYIRAHKPTMMDRLKTLAGFEIPEDE